MTSELFVFVYLPAAIEPVVAGRLRWHRPDDERSPVEFWYGRSYRQRPESFSLDPLRLPLSSIRFQAEGLTGPLSVFSDAFPDQWGKRALLHQNGGQPLTQPEYLLRSTGRQRIGALEFALENTPPHEHPTSGELNALYRIVELIERREHIPEEWHDLLFQGTSMGGARPKAVLEHDGRLWLAKFPDRDDRENQARIEHATLRLAHHCGIKVPDSRVVPIHHDKEALLIERFDRLPSNGCWSRRHFISAATVCGWTPANDRKGYPLFAEELRRWSATMEDAPVLYRRMLFNLLTSNRDDHHRNHALLLHPDGFRLSPAYDLVAGEGMRRTHAMCIGEEGARPTLTNALSACRRFGLDEPEARAMIEAMKERMKDWESHFAACGCDQKTIDNIRWAILPKELND